MEPTDFEKWCASELIRSVNYIMLFRIERQGGHWTYGHDEIRRLYRAYMAGVRSRLPYQPQPPEE